MKPYQRQFIEFALSKQVLKFGEFTLKSGRKSPYFFNAGLFNTGRDLALLGRFYAEALVDSGPGEHAADYQRGDWCAVLYFLRQVVQDQSVSASTRPLTMG